MKGKLDKELALFLGHCCQFTYDQYKNDGQFCVPAGFTVAKSFKATALGREDWFGFVLVSHNTVVIAFRGTVSERDWISDADISQVEFPFTPWAGKTHRGFTSIYSSCRDDIIDTLKTIGPGFQVYVTGHSLGGALATLCALDIAMNTSFKNVVMMSFASPRTGNPEFADNYNIAVPDSVRIYNYKDIVTVVPPPRIYWFVDKKHYYYRHVKESYKLNFNKDNISKNHSLTNYLKALMEREE